MRISAKFREILSSRSSKVDYFGTNRKRICDFLLVINSSNFGLYLAPFLRYGDLLAENCVFFILIGVGRPHSMFPLEFRGRPVMSCCRAVVDDVGDHALPEPSVL